MPTKIKRDEGKSTAHTLAGRRRYLHRVLVKFHKGEEMRGVMTLAIHLVWCAIGRCRIARILKMAIAILL
jgi:hypothetical protein